MAGAGQSNNPPVTVAAIVAMLAAAGLSLPDNKWSLTKAATPTAIQVHSLTNYVAPGTRTITWPDASGVPAISAVAGTSGRVAYFAAGGLLTDSAGFTTNGSNLTITGVLTATGSGTHAFSGVVQSAEGVVIDRPSSTPYLLFKSAGTNWGYVRGSALGTVDIRNESNAVIATFASALTSLNSAATAINGTFSASSTSAFTGSAAFSASTPWTASNSGALVRATMASTNAAGQTDITFTVNSVLRCIVGATASAALIDYRGASQQLLVQSSGSTRITLTDALVTFASNLTTTTFAAGTASSTSGDGAVVITGGLGVGGNVNTAGTLGQTLTDATTNTISDIHTFRHNGGTVATGFGTGQQWLLESDTTTNRNAARWTVEWATAADATRKARVIHYAYDTSARECLRMEASGTAPMLGVLGAAAIARVTMAAATGAKTRTTFDTATVTLPQLAERFAALVDDWRSFGFAA